jgi:ATP-dependent Clp protease adaptor protein ClpS
MSNITKKPPATPSRTGDTSPNHNEESDLATLDKIELPRKFRVVLLNDDFTPMEFVVYILKRFFSKSQQAAEEVMIEVHEKGAGVAGVFSQEVAEMKVGQVNQYSRQSQHPLKTVMEEE